MAADLSELRAMFADEAREYVQLLNDGILRLEASPSDKGVLHELFRAAHSLKGMAGTVGMRPMVELTHALESVLDLLRSNPDGPQPSEELFDLLFASTSALEEMVNRVTRTEGGEPDAGPVSAEVSRLVEALGRFAGEEGEPGELPGPAPALQTAPAVDRVGPVPEAGSPPLPPAEGQERREREHHPLWFLQPEQLKAAAEAAGHGQHVYALEVVLAPDCVFKGARAYTVLRALEGVGAVVGTWPTREALVEERFDDRFLVALVTPRQAAEVEQAALGVTEVRQARASAVPIAGGPAQPGAPLQLGGASASVTAGPVKESTVRVETNRLDALVDLVGELVITTNQVQDAWQNGRMPEESQVNKLARVTSDLQSAVMRLRMVPLKQIFSRFPRTVRDLARRTGKQVQFVIEGEETELDRNIVNEMGEPLLHLLRNAIDHGIEPPEERLKAGKPAAGRVRLSAYHEGNHVVIELEDDGAGIDVERIREKAVSSGRLTPDEARRASPEDLLQLIFEPGFSTADQVTEVSGRGVGMDAAKAAVESLGGRLTVHTRRGRGTLCVIRLPLTLAIIRALLLETGGEVYALPAEVVQSIERVPPEPERVRNRPVMRYRGKVVPIVRLNERLGLPIAGTGLSRESDGLAVVISTGRRQAAVAVDRVVGLQEVVIRNLGGYASVPGVAGATILGSGRVALILDALWLV